MTKLCRDNDMYAIVIVTVIWYELLRCTQRLFLTLS